MRDTNRIDQILEAIRRLWKEQPDTRFGQLLINYGIMPDSLVGFIVDDYDTYEKLKDHIADMEKREDERRAKQQPQPISKPKKTKVR